MADGSTHFDSSSDRVTFTGRNNFSSDDYTVELFYSLVELPSTEVILYGNYNTLGNFAVRMALDTGGNLLVNLKNNANVTFANVSSAFNGFNRWNHVAVVGGSSNHTVYVNGIGSSFTSNTAALQTGNTGVIGYQASGTWSGAVSNFRSVIGTRMYTANFTVPQRALTTVSNSFVALNDNRSVVTTSFAGDTSNSVYFDGTGDYLVIANNDALNLGSGDFTFECWIYWTDTNNIYKGIFGKRASNSGWTMALSNTNPCRMLFYISGVGNNIASAGDISRNTWYHLAWVRNSGTVTYYLNGQSVATLSYNTANTNSFDTVIGISQNVGSLSELFGGSISNARFVKGTALYTANFTPSTSALTAVANTSLLTCQSSTIRDNSSNNFTITVNGDTAINIANPFVQTTTSGIPMTIFSNPFTPTQGIIFQEDFDAELDSAEEIQVWQGSDNRNRY